MVTIKIKEHTDKYGIKYLLYKKERKTVCYIQYPVEWVSKKFYRVVHGGLCFDYKDLDRAKSNTESCLNNIYFNNVKFVYL